MLSPLPSGAPVAATDLQLCEILDESRRVVSGPVTVGLLGGDLCKTLGGRGESQRLYGPEALTVPVDLGIVKIDGVAFSFVSHVLVGELFGKDFIAIMNAQWCGALDLGPRSHPGDGLLDITIGSLSWNQRRMAKRRALTGTHTPHPQLVTRRLAFEVFHFDHEVRLSVDSSPMRTAHSLEFSVEPDAFYVVI